MLNNQHSENSPVVSLAIGARYAAADRSIVASALSQLADAIQRRHQRRKCEKLHRETQRELSGLSDEMLKDIGWPARYEEQNPYIRGSY